MLVIQSMDGDDFQMYSIKVIIPPPNEI